VEHLIHDDGKLSKKDIDTLEEYREDLGLDKEIPDTIIQHIIKKEKNES
jgi:hypothetical protein